MKENRKKRIEDTLKFYFDFEDVSLQIEKLNNHFDKSHQLGDCLENGTVERVHNASEKAIAVFEKVFIDSTKEITLLIYEFPEPNAFNAPNSFLHSQINNITDPIKISKKEFDIFLIKAPIKNINYKEILKAIVNTEMGFNPSIDQIVYFLDFETDNAFVMYDDRFCLTKGI